jgi:hypothetical protein
MITALALVGTKRGSNPTAASVLIARKQARKNLGGFQMIGREPIARGAALHYSGTAKGMMLEFYRGAFAEGSRGYQVIAFATPETFGKLRDEITSIVKSFHSRCDLAR